MHINSIITEILAIVKHHCKTKKQPFVLEIKTTVYEYFNHQKSTKNSFVLQQ